MIESGEKTEEYRDIKESIVSLLFDWKRSGLTRKKFTEKLKSNNKKWIWGIYLKEFNNIQFFRGYSKNRKMMIIEHNWITIDFPKREWCDNNSNGLVFVLFLEKILIKQQ